MLSWPLVCRCVSLCYRKSATPYTISRRETAKLQHVRSSPSTIKGAVSSHVSFVPIPSVPVRSTRPVSLQPRRKLHTSVPTPRRTPSLLRRKVLPSSRRNVSISLLWIRLVDTSRNLSCLGRWCKSLKPYNRTKLSWSWMRVLVNIFPSACVTVTL